MSNYNIVAETAEYTVVSEYRPETRVGSGYQSEAELESGFISLLRTQGYEYLPLHDEAALITNLRKQLDQLNGFAFSDGEWGRFFPECIANSNEGIVGKDPKSEDHVRSCADDGSTKNIRLIDKKNVHNNRLQVINQYEESGGAHGARYDVTILVNGLPLVHAELKRRGVAIREAFNQIKRYQRDSFWAASGLFEYVQIFIISNGTTRSTTPTPPGSHVRENAESERRKSKKTSNSFEFTSFWADGNNRAIPELADFTRTFLAKHTLLNVLTKYCVFTSEDLAARPAPLPDRGHRRISPG